MNVIVIQSKNDFNFLKKYILENSVFFAWHPQSIDECLKRKVKFVTFEDICHNQKSKFKYKFVKEITNYFKNLDHKIKKKCKKNNINFFINHNSYLRRNFFMYFNEVEKLEYLIKYFSKKKIVISCYKENILNPLSFILNNIKLFNLKIIKINDDIDNSFIKEKDLYKFSYKKNYLLKSLPILNYLINIVSLVKNKNFFLADYFSYLKDRLFRNTNKKYFFVGHIDKENYFLLKRFKKKNIFPFYLNWINCGINIENFPISFKIIESETENLKFSFIGKPFRNNLKKGIIKITSKVFLENFREYHKIFKNFDKIKNDLNFKFALSKYINEPIQAMCFDQLAKKMPLIGTFHGGGTYLYNNSPICDVNYTSDSTKILRFVDNNYVKKWMIKQNKMINKVKTEINVASLKNIENYNIRKKNKKISDTKFLYITSHIGLSNGCDNKWSNHEDASYYKFLLLLVDFFEKNNLNLSIKIRRNFEKNNLLLFESLNKKKFRTVKITYEQNKKNLFSNHDVFLSSHYSTHMQELIYNNLKVIYLCKNKNHNINSIFYNNLKKTITLVNNEKSFFKSILNKSYEYEKSKSSYKNFKENFIFSDNIDQDNFFSSICKKLKLN